MIVLGNMMIDQNIFEMGNMTYLAFLKQETEATTTDHT